MTLLTHMGQPSWYGVDYASTELERQVITWHGQLCHGRELHGPMEHHIHVITSVSGLSRGRAVSRHERLSLQPVLPLELLHPRMPSCFSDCAEDLLDADPSDAVVQGFGDELQ